MGTKLFSVQHLNSYYQYSLNLACIKKDPLKNEEKEKPIIFPELFNIFVMFALNDY